MATPLPLCRRVDALVCQHFRALEISPSWPLQNRSVHRTHRTSRFLSTSGRSNATSATPTGPAPRNNASEVVRLVPASPSYFSGKPDFTDSLLSLQALLRKHQILPLVEKDGATRRAWKNLAQYRLQIGESVKAAKYTKISRVLNRLNLIHPSVMPDEVQEALALYQRYSSSITNVARPVTLDEYGRARGVGRRKSSTARVWLVEGEGDVLINGKSITQAFDRLHDRESAIWPLKATQRMDKYNVWALVKGGGFTGQAEALTLGLAKALLVHEPALKPVLRRGTSSYTPPEHTVARSYLPALKTLRIADLSPLANVYFRLHSRLRDKRSTTSRAEEAGQAEGKENACVGQEIEDAGLHRDALCPIRCEDICLVSQVLHWLGRPPS